LKPNDSYQFLSDEELVAQIVKNKNTILFGVLYDRYIKLVYNKCYGFASNEEEAKDLTQEVFIKLFIQLGKYKNQGSSKFSSWLFVFVYNFCVNYVNRNNSKKIEKQSISTDEYNNLVEEPSDENLYEIKVERLEQVLELIPPEDKSILLLKYKEELSIQALAKLLEVGESAIKMRLKRAKAKVLMVHNEKFKVYG
jgi:RNA polymerase sigma-70 factor (ECF subfamily)